jgi:hypothetical protein
MLFPLNYGHHCTTKNGVFQNGAHLHKEGTILNEAFESFGDKSEYFVAAPQYRAAANAAMSWKNANLQSEMTRLLRRAGVSGWPRLFHSVTLQEGRTLDASI